MTVITTPSTRHRTTPVAAHVFAVPVVRELPSEAVTIRAAATASAAHARQRARVVSSLLAVPDRRA